MQTAVINGTRPLRGGNKALVLASLQHDPFGELASPRTTVVALRTNEMRRSVSLPVPVPIATTWLIAVRPVRVTNLANVAIELRLYGQQHVAP
jgi:hypothetical protein